MQMQKKKKQKTSNSFTCVNDEVDCSRQVKDKHNDPFMLTAVTTLQLLVCSMICCHFDLPWTFYNYLL